MCLKWAKNEKQIFFEFSTNRHLNVSLFCHFDSRSFLLYRVFLIISKPLEGAFSKKEKCAKCEKEREIHWDVIGIFLLISPRAFNSIFHFLDQNGVDMYIQIHPRKDWPQMSYNYHIWILFPEMSMGYDSKNNRWGLDVFSKNSSFL